MREWDSHQSRYHSNVQRRFRERSVIAQTETIIEYNNNNAGDMKYFLGIHTLTIFVTIVTSTLNNYSFVKFSDESEVSPDISSGQDDAQ